MGINRYNHKVSSLLKLVEKRVLPLDRLYYASFKYYVFNKDKTRIMTFESFKNGEHEYLEGEIEKKWSLRGASYIQVGENKVYPMDACRCNIRHINTYVLSRKDYNNSNRVYTTVEDIEKGIEFHEKESKKEDEKSKAIEKRYKDNAEKYLDKSLDF